jgi:hypothetical protein
VLTLLIGSQNFSLPGKLHQTLLTIIPLLIPFSHNGIKMDTSLFYLIGPFAVNYSLFLH